MIRPKYDNIFIFANGYVTCDPVMAKPKRKKKVSDLEWKRCFISEFESVVLEGAAK